MNRDKLWSLMKQYGITQSTRMDCPPDGDLKVVMQVCRVSGKAYVDFLLALAKNT